MEQRIKYIWKAKDIKIISVENTVDLKNKLSVLVSWNRQSWGTGISNIIVYRALWSTWFFAGISKDVDSFPGKNLNIL